MTVPRNLHIAIPAMNERTSLPATLKALKKQRYRNYRVWVCVNQPESWWQDPTKKAICDNNRATLADLQFLQWEKLHIIDRSSPGYGWKGKAYGVGQARKTIMDAINRVASDSDLIVSMDADTLVDEDYLDSVAVLFERYPEAVALSNPYYHPITGEKTLDRAMLRYEIYMRHYAINLWRIRSPYSFTALGSAIVVPISSYRKIGGMTAKKSGEDFYLLQKLRKTGWIANYNTSIIFPSTRYSDRVFFGTGPALIKGSQGLWDSYPIYDYKLFDKIAETYQMFPELLYAPEETPMSKFLNKQFNETDIFEPLRKNHKSIARFIDACHHKVDALRILQFLKFYQAKQTTNDEERLLEFLETFYPDFFVKFGIKLKEKLDFRSTSISVLDGIRNFLMEKERAYQKNEHP